MSNTREKEKHTPKIKMNLHERYRMSSPDRGKRADLLAPIFHREERNLTQHSRILFAAGRVLRND